MSSNKRKSPPNKFEETQVSSGSRLKEDPSPNSVYEDRLHDPTHRLMVKPKTRKSAGPGEEFMVTSGPLESGDEMSDLGSFCSRSSSDAEECDGLLIPGGKVNGRCGVRRTMNCRESTSGESSSAKSPTLLHPNHNDAKNSRKSMDDVLRKLTSRFSAGGDMGMGSAGLSLDNR